MICDYVYDTMKIRIGKLARKWLRIIHPKCVAHELDMFEQYVTQECAYVIHSQNGSISICDIHNTQSPLRMKAVAKETSECFGPQFDANMVNPEYSNIRAECKPCDKYNLGSFFNRLEYSNHVAYGIVILRAAVDKDVYVQDAHDTYVLRDTAIKCDAPDIPFFTV